jgi:multisubunit Na+/H+ antiporter MnhE subunit
MIFIAVMTLGLTLVYALTLASFAWQDLVLGAALSLLLLRIYRRSVLPRSLPASEYVVHIIVFLPKFLAMLAWDIIQGTWQVATYVLGLKQLDHPGIVSIPLGNHSPGGAGIVGLFITLSPGSFLVDIDWDQRVMFVHAVDASDPDAIRESAEKYYRLWEYSDHMPQAQGPAGRTGDG